jgi:hypothetical protein
MEPNIIVMITMLLLPNGDSGVHVKPFDSPELCAEAADIEASDPFVRHVECSKLDDGVLTLHFKRNDDLKPAEATPANPSKGTGAG